MGQIELVLRLTVWVTLASFVSSDVPVPDGGFYQTKYDALDVEDVLNHKRLVHHYAFCLLNRGPCPPQGADLKRILPESLETTCLRCTEKQKMIIIKSIRRLRSEYPSLWKQIVDFYDPSEERIRRMENEIAKQLFGGDESNFIGNRFGDSDSGNELAGSVHPSSDVPSSSTTARPSTTTTTRFTSGSTAQPPIYPPPAPTTAKPSTTTTTRFTSGSTAKPPTYLPPRTTAKPSTTTTTRFTSGSTAQPPIYPPPAPTTAKPSTTTTTIITSGSTAKPLSFSPSYGDEAVDSPTTKRPSFLTRWRLTTVPTYGGPTVIYTSLGWRPSEAALQPFNIPLLKVDAGIRFLGDIGSSFLQAGTEVAGMVLSTVQQVFGGQPVN